MALLRELKARKAKYGFECSLNASAQEFQPKLMRLSRMLLDIDDAHNCAYTIEHNFSCGNANIYLYTDDDKCAESIRAHTVD